MAGALGTAAQPGPSSSGPDTAGGSAGLLLKNPDHPKPPTFDRLPLDWYKQTVRRLQGKLELRGLDGILITDRWNITYYTGLFHTSLAFSGVKLPETTYDAFCTRQMSLRTAEEGR